MPERNNGRATDSTCTVPSPCIRNCCLDDEDICLGCFRSLEEIIVWGTIDAIEKRRILEIIAQRRKERTND
jgi:predicted Fe-S protein YdhL (DUF1289 family)